MSTLFDWLEAARRLAERIPYSLVALVARIAVAMVFWRAAQTKMEGSLQITFTEYFPTGIVVEDGFLQVADKTFFLFAEEYKVPLLPAELAAYLGTYQELIGSVLLIVGLATRLTAFAFIGMVAIIQTFVYPNAWPVHLLWFAPLFLLLARGPGAISLDHLIWRRRAQ